MDYVKLGAKLGLLGLSSLLLMALAGATMALAFSGAPLVLVIPVVGAVMLVFVGCALTAIGALRS